MIHGDAYLAYFNKIWGIPDLQGIAGKALQEIEALNFPLLESSAASVEVA